MGLPDRNGQSNYPPVKKNYADCHFSFFLASPHAHLYLLHLNPKLSEKDLYRSTQIRGSFSPALLSLFSFPLVLFFPDFI